MTTVLIGAGAAGRSHAAALPALGITLSGVLDKDPAAARAVAQEYDCPLLDGPDALDAALARSNAVHLCTPPADRLDYAEQAARHGCHLLLEKPMATTPDEGERIVELAAGHGIHLMTVFNHRHRSGFQRLLEIVRSGQIGEVQHVSLRRTGYLEGISAGPHSWRTEPRQRCGVAIESLSHEMDMLLEIAPGVEKVTGSVLRTFPAVPHFDTVVVATLELSGGATALIHAQWDCRLSSSARTVVGTHGSVELTGRGMWDFDELRIDAGGAQWTERLDDGFPTSGHYSFGVVNRRFLELVESAGPDSERARCTRHRGLDALRLSQIVLDSARIGLPVPTRQLPSTTKRS